MLKLVLFWWIELGNVHGSRLELRLIMMSILSLFGGFFLLYFLLLVLTTHVRLLEICAHEQTRAIPFPRENRIPFSCCCFYVYLFFPLLLSLLGHLYIYI